MNTRRVLHGLHGGGFLMIAGLLTGCNTAVPVAETPPPPVTVSQPVVRDVITYDDYEGRIAPRTAQPTEVRARVRGHLTKVTFVDGQIVKQGELLFEIDQRPYQAALASAEAQVAAAEAALELAKSQYAREAGLLRSNASSRQEVEITKAKQGVAAADLLKAQAAVREASLDLEYTKVTAPIGGKISRPEVAVGSLVNAGGDETLLTTIVPVDPMYVYFDVPERALQEYREQFRKRLGGSGAGATIRDLNIPISVALDSDRDSYPHHGVLDFSDNRINPSTGTIQVRGELPNKKGLLDSGMRARVRVPVSNRQKALLIVERAVGNDQGRKFVYVVNADNVALRRDVTLGRLSGGLQVISEGLQPEDWIVVNGIQRVRDGAKVEPTRVPMPGTSSNQGTLAFAP